MNPKKTPQNRKPSAATHNLQAGQAANTRSGYNRPSDDPNVVGAKNRPRYSIKSAPAKLSLDYGVGKTEPAWARVTLVVCSTTGHVMAATVHFEPCCDLTSAGGDPNYDPANHGAAEIEHFRRLFPGQTN